MVARSAHTGGTTLIAGNVSTTSLLAGGVTIDTDGLNVSTAAVMTGPGCLTKKGLGTLTVNSVQAYTGATRDEEVTLRLTQPYLANNGDVHLCTGAPTTTYVCKYSEDLVTPFEASVTDPATITTDGSGAASFTVDASVAKRFYVVGAE